MNLQSKNDAAKIAKGLSGLSVAARTDLNKYLTEIPKIIDMSDGRQYYSALYEATQSLTNKYGTAAQSIALEALEARGISLQTLAPILEQTSIEGMIEESQKSNMSDVAYLNNAIDLAIKRGYRQTIIDNAKGYARVPTGAYTCPWCTMLASRGFVYKDAESAGGTNRWHAYCDCVIVPSNNPNTDKIEGYDPGQLYDLYKQGKGIGERPRESKNEQIEQAKIALDINENQIT